MPNHRRRIEKGDDEIVLQINFKICFTQIYYLL